MGPSFHKRPAHRASAGNDNSAVAAAVRSNARGMGISRDNRSAKRMAVAFRGGHLSGLAGPCQSEASDDA